MVYIREEIDGARRRKRRRDQGRCGGARAGRHRPGPAAGRGAAAAPGARRVRRSRRLRRFVGR